MLLPTRVLRTLGLSKEPVPCDPSGSDVVIYSDDVQPSTIITRPPVASFRLGVLDTRSDRGSA